MKLKEYWASNNQAINAFERWTTFEFTFAFHLQHSLDYFGVRRTDYTVGKAFQGVQTPSQVSDALASAELLSVDLWAYVSKKMVFIA